jgi:hypothetical protein
MMVNWQAAAAEFVSHQRLYAVTHIGGGRGGGGGDLLWEK